MKIYFNRLMIAAACALALSSCDENSWNDKLEGFEEPTPTDVQTIDYTLTADDYKYISNNAANKAMAEAAGASNELKSLASLCAFSEQIQPKDYIPALLTNPNFQYSVLSNGSAMKITYNMVTALPDEVAQATAAQSYTVSDENYQQVWDSDNDYTPSFAPSHTAARSLPGILKAQYPDAKAGDCVMVNYNTSDTDPVFTTAPEPDVPEFTPTSVLGNLNSMSNGDQLDVNGVVMAVSTQGPVVADATGSIFVYSPVNNSDLKIGDQIVLSSTLGSYNYGYQIAKGSEPEVKGTQEVTYPAAKTWTGAEIDQFVADAMASGASPITPVYSKFSGKVTVSGNYINIILDGTSVQVSPYGISNDAKALLTDGATVELEGYLMALASKGKYFNTIVTKIGDKDEKTISAATAAASRVVTVPSVNENAIYQFDGSKWAPMADAIALSHADYVAMGQSYDNLQGSSPESFFPTFLKQKFPYAEADQTKFVVFVYRANSVNAIRCDQYVFDGTEWKLNDGIVTETAQFVKNSGKWNYDPSVTITLPAGRGIEISTLYFQTCIDWVRANVPDGAAYVSSYGNNEYYCGTSAYQGNVDLRASAAKIQYAGYDSMSDEAVVALEKERFEKEVFPAALAILHPDAVPVEGIEVLYTINFFYYTGTTQPATIVYEVTAPATFTFVSCTWNN